MKHILIILALFMAAPATAQNANSQSAAGALAGAQSGSTVNQTFAGSGDHTIRTAPDAIAPSLGSGHPCMINTSVGISIIGGGLSGGQGTVDVGCMMMRSNNPTDNAAGRYYYAAKDPVACVSWRRVGAIPSNQPCTTAEKVAARKQATPSQQPVAALYSLCERRADGKIALRPVRGADVEAAKTACIASLR